MLRRPTRAAATVTTVLLIAACGGDAEEAPTTRATAEVPAATATTVAPSPVEPSTPAVQPTPSDTVGPDAVPEVAGTLASDLDAPWSVVPLPDGGALVSQRDAATVVRVAPDGSATEVGEVPGVYAGGEGGLLGLAVPPGFDGSGWVYAYHTSESDNRVVRMAYDGSSLGEPEVVVDGIPVSGIHNGGRIAFGPDGFLYVPTGDASQTGLSQDLDSLGGKILRVTPSGEPAPGNPFEGSPVWSYGHRNVQGLAWDDEDRLWASEFGQNTWDELNLVVPGGNYGWPEVEGIGEGADYVDPVVVWEPSQASPSGIAYRGGAVYVASLRGERLWQVPVADVASDDPAAAREAVGEPTAYLTEELGRLRAVTAAPDGGLWLLTNNTDGRGDPGEDDDRLVRLGLG